MVTRAVAVAPQSPHPDNAYVQFVQGLAEYRQGRPEKAISFLEDSAEKLTNRPGPWLVLAMAQFRAGLTKEARKTLAKAVSTYNWNASHADHTTVWVSHVLRREAEGLILPNLTAFLDGKHQPVDNDELHALLGVCQFTNRTHALARLYADAFTADTRLAEDFGVDHRTSAARAAALTGCGCGVDAASLGEPERKKWHAQARVWLRVDLTAWAQALDAAPAATRDLVRQRLLQWRSDPDLASLREPAHLDKLPADERKDCVAMWTEVEQVLKRATGNR